MGVHQLLESLSEKLHRTATVRTIYGEPIRAEGKVLVPVARVACGLGAGHAQGEAGEGGGGGVMVAPVGVVEVTPERTRFVPAGPRLPRLAGAFLAGLLLGRLLGGRRR